MENASIQPNHSAIKVVIFDLGGVILRTDDPTPREALAARLGLSRWDLEDIIFGNEVSQRAEAGQASLEEVWAEVCRALNLPPEEIPAVERDFFAGDRVDFDLVNLIRSLRPTYQTVLLSNTWRQDLPAFLSDVLGIPLDTFDLIISSAAYRAVKPHPEIFRLALAEAGVEPEQAVFVDDNRANIEGARALGLHAIRFQSAPQAKAELLALLGLPGERA